MFKARVNRPEDSGVVVARGQQPHQGQPEQTGEQGADDERADPVGPLHVVHGDQDGALARGVLQGGGDAFDQ
ncbi:hypothetical protein [Streptomyces mirabilis]